MKVSMEWTEELGRMEVQELAAFQENVDKLEMQDFLESLAKKVNPVYPAVLDLKEPLDKRVILESLVKQD
jgi:hypothetical protein